MSHQGIGREVADEQLAGIMLALQRQGCHNINFVTPSHVVPQILAGLEIAASRGLNVPLVYTSGGYASKHYRPCGRAHEVPGLEAPLATSEYRRAVHEALEEGLTRLDRPCRVLRGV